MSGKGNGGAKGISRERRPDGNDKCENGHEYPSATALPEPAQAEKTDDKAGEGKDKPEGNESGATPDQPPAPPPVTESETDAESSDTADEQAEVGERKAQVDLSEIPPLKSPTELVQAAAKDAMRGGNHAGHAVLTHLEAALHELKRRAADAEAHAEGQLAGFIRAVLDTL